MKNIALLVVCLLFSLSLSAQQRTVKTFRIPPGYTYSDLIPIKNAQPFLSYFFRWEGNDTQWRIRFLSQERRWSDWKILKRDSHNPEILISELQFLEDNPKAYQIHHIGEGIQDLEVHFYEPGLTRSQPSETSPPEPDQGRACPCPFPSVELRNDWCPSGDCPKIANPVFTDVTHLIVHHSAGTNSASDWAAIVRAIWDFHVIGNGWDDIGYNYLIDPNGVVYEGRGNDVRGAHFCGNNTGTMGVCVLGNFTDIAPTAAAQSSLVELLTWKSCDRNLDPIGEAFHASSNKSLMHISGHQDGCATECPGASFYPLMSNIREASFARIVTACSGLPGPLPLAATIQTGTTIDLAWTDNTEGEMGFLLERSLASEDNYSIIADLAADTEAYTDMVPDMDIYNYRIRAYTQTDTSAYSNIAEVSTIMSSNQEPDLADFLQIQLTPNPTTNISQLQIAGQLNGQLSLSIWTPTGQLLRQWQAQKQSIEWQQNIDLTDLPQGSYLLQIQMTAGSSQLQMIKVE